MTLSLFLLPPVLLSCPLHFLPSADTGGRDSRRGGSAPQPLLPWGCIPPCDTQCGPLWLAAARQTAGETADISHICSSCGRTTDRRLITAPTQLPHMKGCDLVASLWRALCYSHANTYSMSHKHSLKYKSKLYLLSLNTRLPQVFQVTRLLAKVIWRIYFEKGIHARKPQAFYRQFPYGHATKIAK